MSLLIDIPPMLRIDPLPSEGGDKNETPRAFLPPSTGRGIEGDALLSLATYPSINRSKYCP
jgi:hypothetical protein